VAGDYGVAVRATTCCCRYAGFVPSLYVLTNVKTSDGPLASFPK
jgi:hypothetical protein